MAENNGPKWPGPITFNDEEPRKGFFQIYITLKDMKTKKVLLGKNYSPNTVLNEDNMFTTAAIHVHGKVTTKEDDIIEYEYKKPLPEDIKPEFCSHKFKGDKILLTVCKLNPGSWAQHAKYLIKRDD